MTLFRPVGIYELALIGATGFRAFRPRLAEEPTLYSAMNRRYAEEIAFQWNPSDPDSGFAGFVTAFEVPTAVVAAYPAHVVGAAHHEEIWVPAAEQQDFEAAFTSDIAVIDATVGHRIVEVLPAWRGEPGRVCGGELARLVQTIVVSSLVGDLPALEAAPEVERGRSSRSTAAAVRAALRSYVFPSPQAFQHDRLTRSAEGPRAARSNER